MINATEANTNSKARIEKFAKEFIWNEVSPKVHSAIDGGWFHANVSLSEVPNAKYVGPVVVDMLKNEYGYEAEFIYEENYSESCYVCIDWSLDLKV